MIKLSKVVFIIGCPRSGTTILGEFFQNNSNCSYYREIDIWEKPLNSTAFNLYLKTISIITQITRKHRRLTIFLQGIRQILVDFLKSIRFLSNKDNTNRGQRLTADDVLSEMEKKARSYLGEKNLVVKTNANSLRIPFLKKLFPDSKFIHIIRDGRDVICSLMNAPSGFLWSYIKPPGWKEKKKQYKGYLRCAWQWKETIEIINKDKKILSPEDYIEITYEDLVKNPESTMREIFKKLDIPFEQAQKDTCKKISNQVSKENLAIEDRTTILDHTLRIGRFKDEINNVELSKIEKILGISDWFPKNTK